MDPSALFFHPHPVSVMQRDVERVERVSKAVGPELLDCLAQEWTTSGFNAENQRPYLEQFAIACRKANMPPEAMLTGLRVLSRPFFAIPDTDTQATEEAWFATVKVTIDAYYRSPFYRAW